MLNLVKYSNNSRKINVEGFSLLMVSHENELKNEQLEFIDGFIIETNNTEFAKNIISLIRNNDKLTISLLPIFINSVYKLPKNIEIHTDKVISINLINSYIQYISIIQNRINKLLTLQKITHEEFINHKILAYCYTRNTELKPINTRQSLIGYEYPFISILFKASEAVTLLKTLQNLNEQKLLSFTLKDYVHLCKKCTGSYINFRESCPKCNSIDIKAHDMVHHFVCAHVAPEKDFKVNDGLECPKCDKNLRHIGIDYDKPSTIYSCNTCNHEFQNNSMKALCVDCGTEHELDELLEKTIGNYSLTKKGENEVLGLTKSASQKTKESLHNLSIPLFKILLNQEIQRIKTTQCHSIFVQVIIKNEQLQLLNNDVKLTLTKEINSIIKSYLNEADIIASKSYNCHYLMLPETKENNLQRLENIQYNLQKLLTDNLQENKNNILVNYKKITANSNIINYLD